jgi:uncharacterized protein (DUF302 family)
LKSLAASGDSGRFLFCANPPAPSASCASRADLSRRCRQSKLAADAGVKLRPSVLLIFGNPPLGTQFITANANAGLDWPVRLLVYENEKGEVWMAYTDFDWIARRHGIENRKDQFKMASSVINSITSSVKAR